MNYLQATELFLKRKARDLAISKGMASPRTLHTYRYNLELLARFILVKHHGQKDCPHCYKNRALFNASISAIDITSITNDDIRDYLFECTQSGNTAATINVRLNTFRSMWAELAIAEGLTNITQGIPKARHQYKRKASPTRQHLKTLINHFEANKHKNKTSFRNYIFYSIIRFYGLRLSEALGLKVSKIYFLDDALKIEILGKGNKPRVRSLPLFDASGDPLPQCREFYDDLKTFIHNTLPEFAIENPTIKDYLFFSQNKNQWNEGSARLAFYKGLKKVNLHMFNYSPHSLRHAFVSHKLADGVPLQTVSRLVDHANVAITSAIYAHSEEQDLIDGMSKGISLG